MNITYKDNAKHNGNNIEGDMYVNSNMPPKDMEKLKACVEESRVSKEDIENLIKVFKDINDSQNDLTTEFTKMAEDLKAAQKKGTMKKLQEGVTLSNGMVTLGKTAIGIATKNPGLTATGILGITKEMVK